MYFFSGFIFHLTTRADDSHAPPVTSVPEGKGISLYRSEGCQDLVRFFALLRIKPHAPPLVRAPVNSFEFQPCGRDRKSTRLNSSHVAISYAVFCLKKKKIIAID